MPSRLSDQALDRAFAILEQAAVNGERCPVTSGPNAASGIKSKHISELAKAGRIFVEVSSRNWRRVTILTGPNAGKSTAPNPDRHARVYQTVGKEGTRVNGHFVDHGAASLTSRSMVVALKDDDARLPPLLRRPSASDPIAKLSYVERDDADSGAIYARWRLDGSPQVVMMATNLFSGAVSRKKNAVSWPAVEATFEDLLMLQHRYGIEVAPSAAPIWENHYRAAVTRYLALKLGDDTAIVPQQRESRFLGTLLPFQQEGVRFLIAGRRVLLADDMGLGKTPVSLAALDRLDDWPAVVVCQPHVVRHWEKKIEQFLAAAPASLPLAVGGRIVWHTLAGTGAKRPPRADLYVVHYLVLHAWWNYLVELGIRTVVFDEAQELRHTNTKKHDSALALARAARNVFGLSGTPIYNRGPEIFNVFQAINFGCLGTKSDFQSNWCTYEAGGLVVEEPQLLGRYLRDRHLMLRRRKDEVQSELPPKRRAIEPIAADNSAFAELIREAVRLAKNAEGVANPFDRARMEAEAIAETRKATGVAKAPAIVAFLQGLMEAGEPTLVFAHHHAVNDAIMDGLRDYRPAFITGRETMAAKAKAQDGFVRGNTNCCVIALRAATGLDGLQARARVVVFAELDWSPAVHKQAEDRAHRMGQANSVIVYYLVTDLGTDPWIMQTLNVKESQFLGLMHDPGPTDEDRAMNEAATKRHTAEVLAMLRQMR